MAEIANVEIVTNARQTAVSVTPPPQPEYTSPPANPTNTATAMPLPTNTPAPTATQTPTVTPTPTATPIPQCEIRGPAPGDMLAIVTKTYGLSRDYAPGDLVPLADYLPMSNTLGYPSEIRAVAVGPLVQMVRDMEAEGLQPWVMSGYRSYAAQAYAWDKWYAKYPDRVDQLSAPPGHSEHQLGTAVDFGTPELSEVAGPGFEFHTYFYKTGVGVWLAENAHKYGFSLSYPANSQETTGFTYEPWHYRYVGIEMATLLFETNQFLTQYQLANQPEPCVP